MLNSNVGLDNVAMQTALKAVKKARVPLHSLQRLRNLK